MGDNPDPLISFPAGFESIADPCGDNPFPPGDPRYQIWSEATREAEENLFRLDSELLQRMNAIPRDGDFEEKFYGLWIETFTGKFDIWAKRGICVVRNDGAIRDYDKWITSYVQAMLALARDNCPERYPKEYLITEIGKPLVRPVRLEQV